MQLNDLDTGYDQVRGQRRWEGENECQCPVEIDKKVRLVIGLAPTRGFNFRPSSARRLGSESKVRPEGVPLPR